MKAMRACMGYAGVGVSRVVIGHPAAETHGDGVCATVFAWLWKAGWGIPGTVCEFFMEVGG